MRLSSSLILILAAITMANAASVDAALPATHKHHLARVKDGKVRVNALDTAKVSTGQVDLKNLKHLVKVAARRGLADVNALHAAHTNVDAVDIKHVAGLVQTLSAHLESQTKTAEGILKLKDHKKQAAKTDVLLDNIKASLANTFIDLHSLTQSTKSATHHQKGSVAKVRLLSRDLLSVLNPQVVSNLISSKDVAGSAGLATLLQNLNVDSVLQGDALSVLTNLKVIETVHKVAKIDTVLASITAIPDAVPLIEAFQGLDSPVAFVAALADIKSITSLVSAVHGGQNEVAKVPGSGKLVAYAVKYGFNTVARVFNVAGVESVLKSVIAVPGSVALLESIKSVADVPAFVSGLQVLNTVSFVKSIQSVTDINALTGVLATVSHIAPVKRQLLDGVKSTVAGLDLQRVLSLKRAIAHVVALPNSTLAKVEAVVKRGLTSGLVDTDVAGLDLAHIAVLKRSIADLSVLDEKEIDDLLAVVRRDVLADVGSLVDIKDVLGITDDKVRRDGLPIGKLPVDIGGFGSGPLGESGATLGLLDPNDGLASTGGAGEGTLGHGGGDLTLLDIHRLASIKRSSLLTPVEETISNLQLLQTLPILKRTILDTTGMVSSVPELLHSVHPLRRQAHKEDNISIALFDDSVETFTTDVTAMLTQVVEISDTLQVSSITTDIKEQIIPLVQAITKSVAKIASVKAPKLKSKLDKIDKFVAKTVESLI
ncbi:hypothetical protein NDA11_006090 [Ustilago hordei]|uniref:Uncharacterized protein n=1 Tax=Ustilago hordei TaxID=120017 RepID=I2G0G8_USTHO|nr:uncharacterized protein UHO2_03538 [Ustilago hordei]KAJ1044264.1 hypothetical protein NDA10_005186 [Ustilago hordei]KAJ1578863.1 hypothetical protein NDA15_001036 [Ustilago hordei]KAJ1580599.1 hypothetical protein NDA12_002582 [Ustilago hordei]KAJ1581582.1 hypothetical protein NDA11_006090 [Ustilago hordei]KAJ1594979.1 hypothetical protein NDA14_005787 [Ustilago hordei]